MAKYNYPSVHDLPNTAKVVYYSIDSKFQLYGYDECYKQYVNIFYRMARTYKRYKEQVDEVLIYNGKNQLVIDFKEEYGY